jgi:predicted nucleotidyltransferase
MARPDLIEKLRTTLVPHGSALVCAYLYGSAARDDDRATSDLDIAVLFRQEPPATLDGMGFDIAGDVERATGRRADVTVLNRAPADLVHRVLRDGVLLYETDRRRRVAFEVSRRAEYFDLLPYLRQYRRHSVDAAR